MFKSDCKKLEIDYLKKMMPLRDKSRVRIKKVSGAQMSRDDEATGRRNK